MMAASLPSHSSAGCRMLLSSSLCRETFHTTEAIFTSPRSRKQGTDLSMASWSAKCGTAVWSLLWGPEHTYPQALKVWEMLLSSCCSTGACSKSSPGMMQVCKKKNPVSSDSSKKLSGCQTTNKLQKFPSLSSYLT